MYLIFGKYKINAVPCRNDIERTNADGKTAAIHFLRFVFTNEQINDFHNFNGSVIFAVEHKEYPHMTSLNPELLQCLKADLYVV